MRLLLLHALDSGVLRLRPPLRTRAHGSQLRCWTWWQVSDGQRARPAGVSSFSESSRGRGGGRIKSEGAAECGLLGADVSGARLSGSKITVVCEIANS